MTSHDWPQRRPPARPARRALICVVAWLAALLAVAPLAAVDGDLDPSFAGDGKASFDIPDGLYDETAYYVRADAAGNLIVGGRAGGDAVLLRVWADGTRDTAFGTSGWVQDVFASSHDLVGLELQADGSILALGSTFTSGSDLLARILADGTLDASFGSGGRRQLDGAPVTAGEYFLARAMAVDHQGRVVVAGECHNCGPELLVTRRLANGDPDPSFGFAGWARFAGAGHGIVGCNPSWSCLDWDVMVGADGRTTIASGLLDVYRLDPVGDLDGSFGGGDGHVEVPLGLDAVTAAVLDPVSAAVYLGLRYGSLHDGTMAGGVARLLPDGSLDTDFGFGGFSNLTLEEGAWILDLALQSDGRVVAVGVIDANGAQEAGFYLARLLPDGSLDPSFDDNGVARYEFDLSTNGRDLANAVTLSSGKAVVAGVVEKEDSQLGGAVGIVRTQSALIFTDAFEPGTTAIWSSSVP